VAFSRLVATVVLVGVLTAACAATRIADTTPTAGMSGSGAPPAPEIRTTRDGAFTAAQAERGQRVYDASCVGCHPASFYEAQLPVWRNAPVSELLDALSASMPAENPGALPTSQYVDVIAYILSITGSPAGERELTTDNARDVRIAVD